MRKAIDLSGQRFGRLVVRHRIEGTNTWLCKCDCGVEKPIERYDLKPNHIKSCGCLRREKLAKGNITHGLNRTPIWYMWITARSRAKKKNIPFALTLQNMPKIPSICPVLGIVLQHNSDGMQDSSPTLDRVIPLLGYVPGNVNVISWRANRLKGDASPEELEKIYKYVVDEVKRNGHSS